MKLSAKMTAIALSLLLISCSIVPHSRFIASAISLRANFILQNETDVVRDLPTLEDFRLLFESWKLIFLPTSLLVAYICHTVNRKTQLRFRNTGLRLSLILFTPWIINLKALVKLLYPDLGHLKEILLDATVEFIGSVSLVTFWNLIKEVRVHGEVEQRGVGRYVWLSRSFATIMLIPQQLGLYRLWVTVLTKVDKNGVTQYVWTRCCLSAIMVIFQQLGLYKSWVRFIIQGVLFFSEGYSVLCVTQAGFLAGANDLIWMFAYYKFFKYAVWIEESVVFVLGAFNIMDVSNVLYAIIGIEMVLVSLFQHKFYPV